MGSVGLGRVFWSGVWVILGECSEQRRYVDLGNADCGGLLIRVSVLIKDHMLVRISVSIWDDVLITEGGIGQRLGVMCAEVQSKECW